MFEAERQPTQINIDTNLDPKDLPHPSIRTQIWRFFQMTEQPTTPADSVRVESISTTREFLNQLLGSEGEVARWVNVCRQDPALFAPVTIIQGPNVGRSLPGERPSITYTS